MRIGARAMSTSPGAFRTAEQSLPVAEAGGPARAGVCTRPALRLRAGEWSPIVDTVAEEVPVALQYNGISQAVMLATPRDLDDFALGFSLTEGIVDSISEIHDLEIEESAAGLTIALSIGGARFAALKGRRRQLAGRTGCGLCGIDSLERALPRLAPLSQASLSARLTIHAVLAAMQALRLHQPLHDESGATHAAGFADGTGRLLCVREDVGRHNALDKLIGAIARAGVRERAGLAVVSSRASHEMIMKTVRADIPMLAAVSGVTQLAIRTADDAGLCLAGFVRGSGLSIYAHGERLMNADHRDGLADDRSGRGSGQ